jgi:hypothetical protein
LRRRQLESGEAETDDSAIPLDGENPSIQFGEQQYYDAHRPADHDRGLHDGSETSPAVTPGVRRGSEEAPHRPPTSNPAPRGR